MVNVPDVAVLICPWCGTGIPLALFSPDEEEPGVVVAVCRACHRRVVHQPPPDPTAL